MPLPVKDVLILSTRDSSNVPLITNSNGKDDRDIDFVMGKNTEVENSCSLTWRGEHYVFGGYNRDRQISKIIGCELINIGEVLGPQTNVKNLKEH